MRNLDSPIQRGTEGKLWVLVAVMCAITLFACALACPWMFTLSNVGL